MSPQAHIKWDDPLKELKDRSKARDTMECIGSYVNRVPWSMPASARTRFYNVEPVDHVCRSSHYYRYGR